MKKRNLTLTVALSLVVCLSALLPHRAFGLPNQARASGEVVIRGRGFQVLKDFFARFDQGKTNRVPDEEVKRVLLEALPDRLKAGWDARSNGSQGGPVVEASGGLTVRVLYVEGRKGEKPILALITFTALARNGEATPDSCDERLGGIVILRDSARLLLLDEEKDREGLQRVRILQEKEVHIGGKSVIGLNFHGTNDTGGTTQALSRQELVNFYLLDEDKIVPAGSVLKLREERAPGAEKSIRTIYKGAVIFKKDMKGNIVGILSPYTVEVDGRQTGKGLVRYNWDSGKGAFAKE